jgi:hypothetical protein
MKTPAPYFVDIEVPETVLLECDDVAVAALHPNDNGAVWYRADALTVHRDDSGVVQKWSPQNELGTAAEPVKPNTDNLRLSEMGGLSFEREVNAGLVIDDALVDPMTFSCAIRFASDHGEARTLLTVNPRDHDSYLFLSEKDGHISWQDQKDQSTASIPTPKRGGWIVAGFNEGKLSLSTASVGADVGLPVSSEAMKAELAADFLGASDIFIGCRSHRKGITKTLGSSRVMDVLLWIDQDVCAKNPDQLNAVLRHCENEGRL